MYIMDATNVDRAGVTNAARRNRAEFDRLARMGAFRRRRNGSNVFADGMLRSFYRFIAPPTAARHYLAAHPEAGCVVAIREDTQGVAYILAR